MEEKSLKKLINRGFRAFLKDSKNRMNDPQANFPFTNVEIRAGRILFPIEWATKDHSQVKQYTQPDVMCYYARYHNNGINPGRALGDRVMEPLGKDPVAAYTGTSNSIRTSSAFGAA